MKATCDVMETKKIVQDDVACIRCVGILLYHVYATVETNLKKQLI